MTKIISGLLNDTLSLVQLARETALARGKNAQAQRLSPVADELKTLAKSQKAPQKAPQLPPTSSTLQQNDFQTLLVASGSAVPTPVPQVSQPSQTLAANDRNRVVLAMASAKTPGIDIARQMGMTLDEVSMVLSANQKSRTAVGVQK